MSEHPKRNDPGELLADEWTKEWMQEHLPELKQSISGPRLLYQSLVLGFVVGLAAHIGGYVLQSSVTGGFLGLLADLLLALGWSLWTGVVVAVFVEVIPEVKRRQIKRFVDRYEALQRKQAEEVIDKPRARRAKREQVQKPQRKSTRKDG